LPSRSWPSGFDGTTPKTFALTITNTGDGTLRFEEDPYLEVLEGC